MTWGFPLALKGKQGRPLKPKPVTNAREDKLHTAFWSDSFEHRRCLIPVTAWAEAEGEKGRMTRTWHSLPGNTPFAVAGVWRPTAEWADASLWLWSIAAPAWPRFMIECRL
ncbi:MAG: SOS response-associated peptidase family protein [Pseudomonadota bacterium]